MVKYLGYVVLLQFKDKDFNALPQTTALQQDGRDASASVKAMAATSLKVVEEQASTIIFELEKKREVLVWGL